MSPARFIARIRRGNSLGRTLRRGIGGTILAAYVVVAAGIPLPTASRPTRSDELFPCASNGCGCDSAEHCWRSCCCHTLTERLAWAERNGVAPPDFALEAAALAGLDAAGRPLSRKVVNVSIASCCHSKATCGGSSTNQRTDCSPLDKPQSKEKAANFFVALRAFDCHGQSLNWLAAVPTLISVEPELSNQFPLVAWLGPHSSAVAAGVVDVPTPPPPERA